MLQRIQTIFMFLAVVAMGLVLVFPIWEKSDQNFDAKSREYAIMNAFELRYEQRNAENEVEEILATESTLPISIGAGLSALVMLISITQFKNRMTQVKLNALFSLLAAATFVGIYLYISKANALFDPSVFGIFLVGFYLPIFAMLNNFIANRFIRKDEKLVRSMDRIR
ncbi:MAG: DUF4293 domain-containing protein [Bacteroidota bacterium]